MAYTARYVNPRFTLEHRVFIGMLFDKKYYTFIYKFKI